MKEGGFPCEWDRSAKQGFQAHPCFVCGLGITRELRDSCPFEDMKKKADDAVERLNRYREGLGEELAGFREYRSTGEPANSDRAEVAKLVAKVVKATRLANATHKLKVAQRTAGGDRTGAYRELLDALHEFEGGRRPE